MVSLHTRKYTWNCVKKMRRLHIALSRRTANEKPSKTPSTNQNEHNQTNARREKWQTSANTHTQKQKRKKERKRERKKQNKTKTYQKQQKAERTKKTKTSKTEDERFNNELWEAASLQSISHPFLTSRISTSLMRSGSVTPRPSDKRQCKFR